MFPIRTKNRKAISAVLTTIIILVASIVLGTGVVVFSTGLFQTGGQQQAVTVTGLKGWVNATNSTGISWGAFAIKNTGDKLLAVSSISVRSVSVPYANWYADTQQIQVSPNFQAQLNYTTTDRTGFIRGTAAASPGCVGSCLGTWAGTSCVQTFAVTSQIVIQEVYNSPTTTPICLLQQSGPVSLAPGASAIIYFRMPTGLFGTTDSGVTSTISVLAGNAPIAQTIRFANS